MFDNMFILYLITRLDQVLFFSTLIGIFGTITFVVSLIGYFSCTPDPRYDKDSQDHDEILQKNWLIIIKKCRWVALACVLTIIVPSKEDVKFIIAGTGLIEIAKTDTAKEIASKSVSIVEKYLDKIDQKVNKPDK
jgi:hypothetical protein